MQTAGNKKPEVVADVAEAVCWIGQQKLGWQAWALEEFERIVRYVHDYYPFLNVVEGVARLELQSWKNSKDLLLQLSKHRDEVVEFSAVSLLGENENRWLELGKKVLKWIKEREKNTAVKDYVVCHGYYTLRWFMHQKFGRHSFYNQACDLVFQKSQQLCGSAKMFTDTYEERGVETVPLQHYWRWYLAAPIVDLNLVKRCSGPFQEALFADRLHPAAK